MGRCDPATEWIGSGAFTQESGVLHPLESQQPAPPPKKKKK